MSKKNLLIIALSILVIFLAGIIVFISYNNQSASLLSQSDNSQNNISAPASNEGSKSAEANNTNSNTKDPSNWKTYANIKYGYEVKYPAYGSFTEVSSGTKDADDKGYIASFSFGENPAIDAIEITANKNVRNDKTISELMEKRNNVAMVNIPEHAEKIQIDGKPAFKWITYLGEPGSKRIGEIALLFDGGDYYYVIKTGNQYASEFTTEKEEIYNIFLSTFKFIE